MKAAILVLFLVSSLAAADTRTSANYSMVTETPDAGGAHSTSAGYSSDGSIGGITGLSTVAAPVQVAKAGYIGQLYEVTGLVLGAGSVNVNETATLQLAAWQSLDDSSHLSVPAASVAWSTVSGPISGIDPNGLATAAAVYQDTAATVQGSLGGLTGMLNLTVLETVADNFGTYAADGISDDWQFQYFGSDNANAAPQLDPDFDGHSNLFEFTAGLVPTDAASVFHWRVEPVPGFPTQKRLIFSPLVAGRSYTVKSATTLGVLMQSLGSFTTSDANGERTVTDLNASGTTRFYRVEITRE